MNEIEMHIRIRAVDMLATVLHAEAVTEPKAWRYAEGIPAFVFTIKDNTEAGIMKTFLHFSELDYSAYPHKDYADRGWFFVVWERERKWSL